MGSPIQGSGNQPPYVGNVGGAGNNDPFAQFGKELAAKAGVKPNDPDVERIVQHARALGGLGVQPDAVHAFETTILNHVHGPADLGGGAALTMARGLHAIAEAQQKPIDAAMIKAATKAISTSDKELEAALKKIGDEIKNN